MPTGRPRRVAVLDQGRRARSLAGSRSIRGGSQLALKQRGTPHGHSANLRAPAKPDVAARQTQAVKHRQRGPLHDAVLGAARQDRAQHRPVDTRHQHVEFPRPGPSGTPPGTGGTRLGGRLHGPPMQDSACPSAARLLRGLTGKPASCRCCIQTSSTTRPLSCGFRSTPRPTIVAVILFVPALLGFAPLLVSTRSAVASVHRQPGPGRLSAALKSSPGTWAGRSVPVRCDRIVSAAARPRWRRAGRRRRGRPARYRGRRLSRGHRR